MPVEEPEIREALPGGGEAVSDTLIQGFINSWTRRVELEAGTDKLEDPMALDIIRLGATGDARLVFDQKDAMRLDSPISTKLLARAEAMLVQFDKLTGSSTETGRVHSEYVKQVTGGPWWYFEEFGFDEGSFTSSLGSEGSP